MDDKFEEKWIDAFAPNVSLEKRQKIGVGGEGYLWHACSFDLIEHVEGEKASELYDTADKEGAIEVHYEPWRKCAHAKAEPLKASHKKALDIEKSGLIEFYVIGRDYDWCYIVTHETDLGPYFITRR